MISRFIKNNLKIIIAVGLTAIICISGTVLATGYFAKDITYTREGTNIKSVEDALNDLYNKGDRILLWTNENQNLSFGAQDITLSSSITNYTHILLKWKNSKSSTTIFEDIFKLSNDRNGQAGQGTYSIRGVNDDASGSYTRTFIYVQNNSLKLHFNESYRVNMSAKDNDRCIPLEIYGLNL